MQTRPATAEQVHAAPPRERQRLSLAELLVFTLLVACAAATVSTVGPSIYRDEDRLLASMFWIGLAAGIVTDRCRGTRVRYGIGGVCAAMLLAYLVLHTPTWHAWFQSNYKPTRFWQYLPSMVAMIVVCSLLGALLAFAYRLLVALLSAGPRGWWLAARARPRLAALLITVGVALATQYGLWLYSEANYTWQETSSFIAFPNDPGYRHPADCLTVSREGDWIAVSGIRQHFRNSPDLKYGEIAICHWHDGPQPLPEALQENAGLQPRSVSFSPDSDLLMVADGTTTLRLVDPDEASVVQEIPLDLPAFAATWLNDGRYVTRGVDLFDTITLRDLSASRAAPEVSQVHQFADPFACYLVQAVEGGVIVNRRSDGSAVLRIAGATIYNPPAFSADGRWMILGQNFCDLANGTQSQVSRPIPYGSKFAAHGRIVSRTPYPGPLVAVLQPLGGTNWIPSTLVRIMGAFWYRSRMEVWDPLTGRVIARTRSFREPIHSFGVSHDGRVVAAMIGERIYVWDVPDEVR